MARKARPKKPTASPLMDLLSRAGASVATALKEPLTGLARDVQQSFVHRSAQALAHQVGRGLQASAHIIIPALRLLSRVPEALDAAARRAAEDGDDEDWTRMGEEAKNRYRRFVSGAMRGFEIYLASGQKDKNDE